MSKTSSENNEIEEVLPPVPVDFFSYCGSAKKEGNSMYRCLKCPTVRKMFIELNTGLPSSAAVERLFSLGGRVFTPLRTSMSSYNFEMLMFLRMSKTSN